MVAQTHLPVSIKPLFLFCPNLSNAEVNNGNEDTTIKNTATITNSTNNGEHPFWVVCEEINEADDTIYRYTSHKVYEDLTYRIKPGDHVAIYIDPKNPDRYYVNLDQIM